MTDQVYRVGDTTKYSYLDRYYGCVPLSSNEFTNTMDALAAAKKEAKRTKEDVTIWKIDSVVKFPEPDFTVEKLV